MNSSVAIISAKNTTVEKGHVAILRDISFSVKRGRIVGLIGPSGSGKTTLLRAIVGVQRISSGILAVKGMPAGSAALRKRIGYVTQAPAVYDDLTVEQNIRYFATLVGAKTEMCNRVIATVQLVNKKHQLAATLSGGQRARLSLAIALLGKPSILVLDEPTVGLDPLLRRELWDMFCQLANNDTTIIVSSHVMDEAERCDDLLLLRDGQLLWNDTKEALLLSTGTKSIEAAFITKITEKETA